MLVFKSSLVYFIMNLTCKSDSGNSDMPDRNHEVLPLSEKVKVLNLMRKEKIMLTFLRSSVAF
jgi:hypothetical protein